uniref:Saposin B-type domain-containing protein n=1 Tax=Pseudodiaptomus poplesia TaxID=213370 RepID=A0A1S6GL64_9MAXI|nr:putative protein LOC100176110 isoform X2 [Pseudodiaptomus poplesia]
MLFLFGIFALFCQLATGAVTCDECRDAAGGLRDHLQTDESIAEQISILSQTVCVFADIPSECEELLNLYWAEMAGVLYNHFLEPAKSCQLLELCSKKSNKMYLPRDWSCEDCTDIMMRLGIYMADKETVNEAVELLQGDAFCGNGSHSEDCLMMVKDFVTAALPVMAQVLDGKSAELCQAVVGVC